MGLGQRVLKEIIEYRTRWGIARYKNQVDKEANVRYHKDEARELFLAPQFSVIKGGVSGAIMSHPIVFEKIRQGAFRTKVGVVDLVRTIQHLFKGNLLLNEGINEMWTLICAASGTRYDNSNAYLGVGDDNTAANATQTGLQAAVNKVYVAMEGGFPTYGTSQKASWKASFGSGVGNFDWREFTVANGNSDAADNMNRKVSTEGTKAGTQVWDLTLEITLS